MVNKIITNDKVVLYLILIITWGSQLYVNLGIYIVQQYTNEKPKTTYHNPQKVLKSPQITHKSIIKLTIKQHTKISPNTLHFRAQNYLEGTRNFPNTYW